MTDLVPYSADSGGDLDVAAARLYLDQLESIPEIRDLTNRAQAAEFYFKKAAETRHLANQAVEMRIWAERRAGQLLDRGRCFDLNDHAYQESIGRLGRGTARRWLFFADAPESLLERVLKQFRDTQADITLTSVEKRLQGTGLKRVERGIYVNAFGRHVIRWRSQGVSRQETVGSNLGQARKRLLVVTGKLKPKQADPAEYEPREWDAEEYMAVAYRSIREALNMLGHVRGMSVDGKALLSSVHRSLYNAEDDLGQAMRMIT